MNLLFFLFRSLISDFFPFKRDQKKKKVWIMSYIYWWWIIKIKKRMILNIIIVIFKNKNRLRYNWYLVPSHERGRRHFSSLLRLFFFFLFFFDSSTIEKFMCVARCDCVSNVYMYGWNVLKYHSSYIKWQKLGKTKF